MCPCGVWYVTKFGVLVCVADSFPFFLISFNPSLGAKVFILREEDPAQAFLRILVSGLLLVTGLSLIRWLVVGVVFIDK